LFFDWHAESPRQTIVHLDRPFDVAPDSGVHYDAAALARTVREISGWLHAAGLGRGDRVAIVKQNHFDIMLIAAASARLGALPAMIAENTSLESLSTMLGRIEPRVLVASTRLLTRAATDGHRLADSTVRVVALGPPLAEPAPNVVVLDDLRNVAEPPLQIRSDSEPMTITHTSGTTGVPKLVVHSADTIRAKSRAELIRYPIFGPKHTDTVASAIAYNHARILSYTAGQITMAPRSVVVITDPSPENTVRMLTEHRPTLLEASPNIYLRWEELTETHPELFANVRLYAGTFDVIHPRTVRKFLAASRRRMPVWGQSWGQSEVGPICATMFTRRGVRARSDATAATTVIGWPFPGLVRVRVVDSQTGRKQARGTQGLLMVSSPSLCLTYLAEADRHRMKISGEWWNTGDLGVRGWFGRLRLIDREVDEIPGASSVDLESVLLDRLAGASEVTVLGVPGRPPVPVVCMDNDRLDPADWQRAIRGLPELDEPLLVPWDRIPRTATWKVRRLDLREQVLGTKEKLGSGRWT